MKREQRLQRIMELRDRIETLRYRAELMAGSRVPAERALVEETIRTLDELAVRYAGPLEEMACLAEREKRIRIVYGPGPDRLP